MVSMTRTEAKEAFNHVLDTVLDRGDFSSLKDIFSLITVTDDVIDSLANEDPDDKIFYPVKKGDNMLLRCFLAYQHSLEPATCNVDYRAITQSNFDICRISTAYRAALYQTSSTPPSATISSHSSHYTPVAMFR
jgi:hypothetical protein